jgi:hypothetical protein
MLSYIIDNRGRMKPAEGKRSDRIMAWLIAQMVAREKPIPTAARQGGRADPVAYSGIGARGRR